MTEMNYRESQGPEERHRLGPRGQTLQRSCFSVLKGSSNHEEGLGHLSHKSHEVQGSHLRTRRRDTRMVVGLDRKGVPLLSSFSSLSSEPQCVVRF